MNRAYLLTGGNIGDRMQYLQRAKERIGSDCGTVETGSAVYETEAWGSREQNPYLNMAIKVRTPLTALQLLKCILEIEKNLGRVRTEKYAARTIDIDILLFNDEVIDIDGLIIPHPQLQYRRFALQCLNDIAAEVMHPVVEKTIGQLLEDCEDPLEVKRMDGF